MDRPVVLDQIDQGRLVGIGGPDLFVKLDERGDTNRAGLARYDPPRAGIQRGDDPAGRGAGVTPPGEGLCMTTRFVRLGDGSRRTTCRTASRAWSTGRC